jgi:hypothetical protein
VIRRLNYTGRRKIPRSRVTVRLVAAKRGDGYAFHIDYDLHGLGFPDAARVYVEAYNIGSYMRFAFGTVVDRRDPKNVDLRDVTPRPLPRFRLKVVDEQERLGLLLGVADKLIPLRPEEELTHKQWLLPVDFCDLGDRAWRLDLSDSPVLELNNRIEGIADAARAGGAFLGLVFPEVVRGVLSHILFVLGEDDPNADDSEWTSLWLRYALSLPGVGPIPDVESERQQWVDDAVQVFCRTRQAREKLEVTLRKESQ